MRRITGVVASLLAVGLLQGYAVARQSPRAWTERPPVPKPAAASATASSHVAGVAPAPKLLNPDPKHPAGDLLEVSLDEQRLMVWRDGVVVHQFLISTGRKGYETPAGHFKVHTKYRNRWSRTWKVWMPYAMFWHPTEGYAFHELPYLPGKAHRPIGAAKLGHRDSHGCIRVNRGDAKVLYDFTLPGTPVWIH